MYLNEGERVRLLSHDLIDEALKAKREREYLERTLKKYREKEALEREEKHKSRKREFQSSWLLKDKSCADIVELLTDSYYRKELYYSNAFPYDPNLYDSSPYHYNFIPSNDQILRELEELILSKLMYNMKYLFNYKFHYTKISDDELTITISLSNTIKEAKATLEKKYGIEKDDYDF